MRQRSAEAHLIPTSQKRPFYTMCVKRRCSEAKEQSFTLDELGFPCEIHHYRWRRGTKVQKSGDIVQELIVSGHLCVGFQGEAQAIRCGGECLDRLSHLASPELSLMKNSACCSFSFPSSLVLQVNEHSQTHGPTSGNQPVEDLPGSSRLSLSLN